MKVKQMKLSNVITVTATNSAGTKNTWTYDKEGTVYIDSQLRLKYTSNELERVLKAFMRSERYQVEGVSQ